MAATNYFGNQVRNSVAPKNFVTAEDASQPLHGSDGADKLMSRGLGVSMLGGAGDDTYLVGSESDTVVELSGGGVDTVHVAGPRLFQLGANLENMLVYGRTTAVGNDLANVITGAGVSQVLDGGRGDDVLTGGRGADVFVMRANSGHDVITDFDGSSGDRVRLQGVAFNTFEQVRAALQQDGRDVVLRLTDQDAIRFADTKVSDLKSEHFQFAIDTSKLSLTFNEDFNSLDFYNAATGEGVWKANDKGPRNHDGAYIDPLSGAGQKFGLNPFSVKDGVLTITAAETPDAARSTVGYDYTSGMIETRDTFYQQYGYFEMRAALPQGQGAWPAFWLMPAGPSNYWDYAELDVMEQVASGWSHQAAHYGKGKQHSDGFQTYMGDTSGYHTYGMLWTKEEIAWYIDGVEVSSMPTPDYFHRPMYLIANMSIGGTWAGRPEPDMADQHMQVDYIRAYSVDPNATSANVNGTVTAPEDDDSAGGGDHGSGGGHGGSGGGGGKPVPGGPNRQGTAGDDRMLGSSGDDDLRGEGGADLLRGSAGDDKLDGGAGIDTADYAAAVRGVVVNLAQGGPQDTRGAGTDTLVNVENVAGSDWSDVLTGDGQANSLVGHSGDDSLSGAAGHDSLDGGAGVDLFDGGAGDDLMVGGRDRDTASYGSAEAGVQVSLGVAGRQNTGGAGWDTLKEIENLRGSSFNDTLAGDKIANVLEGAAGADRLNGEGGRDVLVGGEGSDTLTGGTGADTFRFDSVLDSRHGARDVITDFRATDRIDLSRIDADVGVAGDQAFKFIGARGFSNEAGQLRAEAKADGVHLYGDVNGDGVADLHILLEGKVQQLGAADFVA